MGARYHWLFCLAAGVILQNLEKGDASEDIKPQIENANLKALEAVQAVVAEKKRRVIDDLKFKYNVKTNLIQPCLQAYENSFSVIPNRLRDLSEIKKEFNDVYEYSSDYAQLLYSALRTQRYDNALILVLQANQTIYNELEKLNQYNKNNKCINILNIISLGCSTSSVEEFNDRIKIAIQKMNEGLRLISYLENTYTNITYELQRKISQISGLCKMEINNENYLVQRSQRNLKTVKDNLPSCKDGNNNGEQYKETIKAEYEKFKKALSDIFPDGTVSPCIATYAQLQRNKFNELVDKLYVKIESCTREVNEGVEEVNELLQGYKTFKRYCKSEEFKSCVDAYYNVKDAELLASVNKLKVVCGNTCGVIESDIEVLRRVGEKLLKESEEKKIEEEAKKEKDKVESETRKQVIAENVNKYKEIVLSVQKAYSEIVELYTTYIGQLEVLEKRTKTDDTLLGVVTFEGSHSTNVIGDFGACNLINIVNGFLKTYVVQLPVLDDAINNEVTKQVEPFLEDQCCGSDNFQACLDDQLKLSFSNSNDFTKIQPAINIHVHYSE